jgi:hypothetical protein
MKEETMRTTAILASLVLAASTAAAAPAPRAPQRPAPQPATQRCPMCGQMMRAGQGMQGGMMGGGMMNPQMMQGMMQMMAPATVTLGEDGSVYVLRGGTLYKYSSDLKLLTSASLPAPPARSAMPAPGSAPQGHEEHH